MDKRFGKRVRKPMGERLELNKVELVAAYRRALRTGRWGRVKELTERRVRLKRAVYNRCEWPECGVIVKGQYCVMHLMASRRGKCIQKE